MYNINNMYVSDVGANIIAKRTRCWLMLGLLEPITLPIIFYQLS